MGAHYVRLTMLSRQAWTVGRQAKPPGGGMVMPGGQACFDMLFFGDMP